MYLAPTSIFSLFQEKKQKFDTKQISQVVSNNCTSSFYKNQTPSSPHKCQFSVRLAHAATLHLFDSLSLSATASCWNWSTSNRSSVKDPMLCPFPKLWLSLKTHWLVYHHWICKMLRNQLLSEGLFTQLKPERQITVCSTNFLLIFCSWWELKQAHRDFPPADFHDLHAVQLGCYTVQTLYVQTKKCQS